MVWGNNLKILVQTSDYRQSLKNRKTGKINHLIMNIFTILWIYNIPHANKILFKL